MVIVQNILDDLACPSKDWFKKTCQTTLSLLRQKHIITQQQSTAELIIRLVDGVESRHLNQQYRQQDKPTNVLSFNGTDLSDLPAELQTEVPRQLGALVICLDIVKTQAKFEQKTLTEHLTQLLIHGILHLLGYNHLKEDEAVIMEGLEYDLLAKFDIYLERL